MDENTIKSFESNQLGLDDTFRFHCIMCGKCCIYRDDILLNPRDVYNMAKELNITPQTLIQKYCEVYIGESSRIPIVRLRPQGSDMRCPMLKDKKCIVHSAKPTVCALYPLGRGGSVTKGQETKSVQPIYFLNGSTCGDNSETHTVREWLERFGIPEEDEFFSEWQKVIIELYTSIAEREKKVQKRTMQLLWNAILINMYYIYDTSEDFLPQFTRNKKKLLEMLEEFNKIQ